MVRDLHRAPAREECFATSGKQRCGELSPALRQYAAMEWPARLCAAAAVPRLPVYSYRSRTPRKGFGGAGCVEHREFAGEAYSLAGRRGRGVARRLGDKKIGAASLAHPWQEGTHQGWSPARLGRGHCEANTEIENGCFDRL